jgi:beta-glucosidase
VATLPSSGASAATAVPAATRCGSPVQRPWCNQALAPAARAQLLESVMTTSEKIGLLTLQGVPSLGLPTIHFSDGALGVRGGTSTALPAGISLAAGFDPFEAYLYGSTVGADAKAHGDDGIYGPTVNIMRTPYGGRAYEAYGEDPYLTASTAVGWIDGLQAQGVMADVKHYVANDQEGQLGVPIVSGTVGGRLFVDIVVDQRTLHEIYLVPFEAAVTLANTATVMCAYNQVNGSFNCENGLLLQQVLEKQFGFQGFVVSDFGAAHNTEANINNGDDVDILGASYSQPAVEAGLAAGLISMKTLDEHVLRILTTLFRFGVLDRPAYANNEQAINQSTDDSLATWVEENGITLLKNEGDVLPLDQPGLSRIAVIGSPADQYIRGSGSSQVSPTSFVTPLRGIEQRAGSSIAVTYDSGVDPLSAAALAHKAQVAIVFVKDSETEGSDKLCMSLDCPSVGLPDLDNLSDPQITVGPQDQLIEAVAQANPNTIVVMETGAPVLTPWRNMVKGIVEAWYPGQEGGTAIAHVLFGDVDPGGRLPATFPASPAQLPTAGNLDAYPGIDTQETYSEGVFVGYRWYDEHDLVPAFPFGYGLSYTTFSYHDLTLAPSSADGDVATATVEITNTGDRTGDAVPELYVAMPSSSAVPEPPLQLKGYTKVMLKPEQTATVRFILNDRSFAYYDSAISNWKVIPGCFGIDIGTSSSDLPLQGVISRLGGLCGPGALALDAPDNAASAAVLAPQPVVQISGG